MTIVPIRLGIENETLFAATDATSSAVAPKRSEKPLALKLPCQKVERKNAPEHTMRQTVKSNFDRHDRGHMLVGLTTAASAAPVLIVNAGFEAPSLVDSQAIFSVAGWVSAGDCGNVRSARGRAFAPARLKGRTWRSASFGGPTISQMLTTTAQANTLYTLTMLVGNRLDADPSAATKPNYGPAAPCWRRTTIRCSRPKANS